MGLGGGDNCLTAEIEWRTPLDTVLKRLGDLMSKPRPPSTQNVATQTEATASGARPVAVALIDDVTAPLPKKPAELSDETTVSGRLIRLGKRRSPVA